MRFLAAGVAQGLRVAYTAPGHPDQLRDHLAGLEDVDGLLAGGALEIISLDEIYLPGAPVDAAATIGAYAAATERALGDGYRGYRVGADATDLVRTASQHEAFMRYEFQVDRYAARHPFSALCAYDTSLGEHAIAELATAHPAAPAALSPFHVYTTHHGAVGLWGEIDRFSATRFRRMLERTQPVPGASTVVYDLSAITFVDHHALLAIEEIAEAHDLLVLLEGGSRVVRRLVPLLGLRRVRIAPGERRA